MNKIKKDSIINNDYSRVRSDMLFMIDIALQQCLTNIYRR